MQRSSGVLMHITSLPSKYGIGTLGEEAYNFVDFLYNAGQKYWQILPIGPTGFGDSPYQSFSAYAGNPYLIDLDILCKEKLLNKNEYENLNWGIDSNKVSYENLYELRFEILKKSYKRFCYRSQLNFEKFCNDNSYWLNNYAVYMAIKKHFNMKSWNEWPDREIKLRHKSSVNYYSNLLSDDINFWKYIQFKFFEQWDKLKNYANSFGIKILGDMPIYVSMDSADTWANSENFWLDYDKRPVCVAGCPPDYFSEYGQLWGNPLYNWEYLKKTNYKWWINRIKITMKMFDVMRIDHFRAFDSYYAIPFGATNAVNGKWLSGPGLDFFKILRKELGEVPIVAEDLGFMMSGVRELLKNTGYPGMKILQFAFDPSGESEYLPHNYNKNCIVYTGTHDNETIMGWFSSISKDVMNFAKKYTNLNDSEGVNWGLIRLAYSSVSNLVIIQMQDFLALSNSSRMNTPSTIGDNWRWRIDKLYLNKKLENKIRNLTKLYGRLETDSVMKNVLMSNLEISARNNYCKELNELTITQLHNVLGKMIMGEISKNWDESKKRHANSRRAYYFSAEFMMGRMVYNNLYALNILDEAKEIFREKNLDLNVFEDIEDAALGNGGLGRLAACFLDSATSHEIPLDGYGIRYKYGLFKQLIKNGFQTEIADDWQKFGDPWSIRREEESVNVVFQDQTVKAVPYDIAVIGYNTPNVNTLRLWQSEAIKEFDFLKFNDQEYSKAVAEKDMAEDISRVLYPNDSTKKGKILRLKQQYFFTSASIQDIVKRYKSNGNKDFSNFSKKYSIQLNDTHPVIAIPELIRVLMSENLSFADAFDIAQDTFAYTNHTVMSEALEKWDVELFKSILPNVYRTIENINEKLILELKSKGLDDEVVNKMEIIYNNKIHMANLAVYASKYTNGVAKLHTEILQKDVLKDWYSLYPERFQNKTNGITQRRWLGLCNPELSNLITDCIGNGWIKDLSLLKEMERFVSNKDIIEKFNKIKYEKKNQLSNYIYKKENIKIDPNFIFDIQVKRLHEYKRQLLNAFSIMDIYFQLKEGSLKDFNPTVFIFGAKAAPGYKRAKAIIKYINEIANLVNNDIEVNEKLKVVFVSNYNCSYAEKIVTAADVSEQISTAGTEASGTGNMKFMLNGTVTLGTFDGANVEIVDQAGEENNYIFGARVEDIEKIKNSYSPEKIYNNNTRVKRIVDTLINGMFDDGETIGEGSFIELYNSLIKGDAWHKSDSYYVLYDLIPYIEAKLKVNKDYSDKTSFGQKCLNNTLNAGMFSSDRTVKQYAQDLWKL